MLPRPLGWAPNDVWALGGGLNMFVWGLSSLLVLHLEQIAVNVIDVTEQVEFADLTGDKAQDILEIKRPVLTG